MQKKHHRKNVNIEYLNMRRIQRPTIIFGGIGTFDGMVVSVRTKNCGYSI